MADVVIVGTFDNVVVLVTTAVVGVLVVGLVKLSAVVVVDGNVIVGALVIPEDVVVIGAEIRLDNALFADEVVGAAAIVVFIGGKPAVLGVNVAALWRPVGKRETGAVFVVAIALPIVDDAGDANERAGVTVLKVAVVVAGVPNWNDKPVDGAAAVLVVVVAAGGAVKANVGVTVEDDVVTAVVPAEKKEVGADMIFAVVVTADVGK